jgi:hypothetical protein
MNRISLLTLIFIFQGVLNLFSQNPLLQNFSCADFDLKYPIKFKAEKVDSSYVFYFHPDVGEIRISVFPNTGLTVEEHKEALCSMNENYDPKPEFKVMNNADGSMAVEYRYTTSDGLVGYVKTIQNESKMYLITVYWQEDSWNDMKEVVLESYNSLKPK